jgi:hypothetical protein
MVFSFRCSCSDSQGARVRTAHLSQGLIVPDPATDTGRKCCASRLSYPCFCERAQWSDTWQAPYGLAVLGRVADYTLRAGVRRRGSHRALSHAILLVLPDLYHGHDRGFAYAWCPACFMSRVVARSHIKLELSVNNFSTCLLPMTCRRQARTLGTLIVLSETM